MVSFVRNLSREAAAAPSRPRVATSRRHPLFLFFGELAGNASAAPRAGASLTTIRFTSNTRTRQRFNRIQTFTTPNPRVNAHDVPARTQGVHAKRYASEANRARRDNIRGRHTKPTHMQPRNQRHHHEQPFTQRHAGNVDAPRDLTRKTVTPRRSESRDHARPRVHTDATQTDAQRRPRAQTNIS